jgi:hypothetical protein
MGLGSLIHRSLIIFCMNCNTTEIAVAKKVVSLTIAFLQITYGPSNLPLGHSADIFREPVMMM